MNAAEMILTNYEDIETEVKVYSWPPYKVGVSYFTTEPSGMKGHRSAYLRDWFGCILDYVQLGFDHKKEDRFVDLDAVATRFFGAAVRAWTEPKSMKGGHEIEGLQMQLLHRRILSALLKATR